MRRVVWATLLALAMCGEERKVEKIPLEILGVSPAPFESFVEPTDEVSVRLNREPEGDFTLKVWRGESEVLALSHEIRPGEDHVEVAVKFSLPLTEGTYTALFEAEDVRKMWYFSVALPRAPKFSPSTHPKSGTKNFPYEGTVSFVLGEFTNPFTLDEETVKLVKKAREGDTELEVVPNFIPHLNMFFTFIPDVEEGTYYTLGVSGAVGLFQPPATFFAPMELTTVFRTVDFTPPRVSGCTPHFCFSSDCLTYRTALTFVSIRFGEGEELDPESVPDNLKIYKLVRSELEEIEYESAIEHPRFGAPRKLFERSVGSNPSATLHIYPDRVVASFSEPITSQVIHIFVLPSLADVSGNSVGELLRWCVVVP